AFEQKAKNFVWDSLSKYADGLKYRETGSQQRRELLIEEEEVVVFYFSGAGLAAKRLANTGGAGGVGGEDSIAVAFELRAEVALGGSFDGASYDFARGRADSANIFSHRSRSLFEFDYWTTGRGNVHSTAYRLISPAQS